MKIHLFTRNSNLLNNGDIKMKNKIVLNFGGFYCSIHEQLIDSMLDGYYDNQDYYNLDIDYQSIFKKYSQAYIASFKEWLNDEYQIDINMSFSALKSPREYNFSTDKIIAFMTLKDENKLINYFKKDADFIAYLKDATQSKSGYISFYSFNDVLANKDRVLSDYLTSYLCDLFNQNEHLNYYDRNYAYDFIYSMDLPQLESELAA